MLPGSAHTQIRVRFQFRTGPLHACVGGGCGFNVELQIAQEGRICGGTRNTFLGRDQYTGAFESLGQQHALHGHFSGDNAGVGGAGQPQISTQQPAHAFGIAYTHTVGAGGEVIEHASLSVINAAGELQLPTADFGGYVAEKKASGVKNQVAFDSAQAGGKIRGAHGGIVDVNSPCDTGMFDSAFHRGVDLRTALHVHIWQGSLNQSQIDGAIEAQRHVLPTRKLYGPFDLQVGVGTVHDYRFNFERFTRRAEAHRAAIFKLHIRVVKYESREICFHHDSAGVLQSTLQRDIAVRFTMTAELL